MKHGTRLRFLDIHGWRAFLGSFFLIHPFDVAVPYFVEDTGGRDLCQGFQTQLLEFKRHLFVLLQKTWLCKCKTMGAQDFSAPTVACFPAIQKMTGLAACDQERVSFPLVSSVTFRICTHVVLPLLCWGCSYFALSQSGTHSVYCLQSCVTSWSFSCGLYLPVVSAEQPSEWSASSPFLPPHLTA